MGSFGCLKKRFQCKRLRGDKGSNGGDCHEHIVLTFASSSRCNGPAQPYEEAVTKGKVSANGYAKGHQTHLFVPVLDL